MVGCGAGYFRSLNHSCRAIIIPIIAIVVVMYPITSIIKCIIKSPIVLVVQLGLYIQGLLWWQCCFVKAFCCLLGWLVAWLARTLDRWFAVHIHSLLQL